MLYFKMNFLFQEFKLSMNKKQIRMIFLFKLSLKAVEEDNDEKSLKMMTTINLES